ncbi:unnamed protein product [Acanthosepion pharaonis]|uniref:Uncharacterized protein n=1 Tax=Acanthosepion pharaonis TaxID=158019 RepID=A0A812DXI2_ACAPH|nr:unnamed protein product [Sepia pharaonis]
MSLSLNSPISVLFLDLSSFLILTCSISLTGQACANSSPCFILTVLFAELVRSRGTVLDHFTNELHTVTSPSMLSYPSQIEHSGLPSIFPISPFWTTERRGPTTGVPYFFGFPFLFWRPFWLCWGLDDGALPLYPSVPPFHFYPVFSPMVPFLFIRICLQFPIFLYFFSGSCSRTYFFLFLVLVPLRTLARLLLILSQSRSLLRAASMAVARVLSPSFRTSPLACSLLSLSLNLCLFPRLSFHFSLSTSLSSFSLFPPLTLSTFP